MPPIKEDNKIYAEYFRITREYQEKYGKNTVLLMQVGSFFEIYGLKEQKTGDVVGSEIIAISNICQFNVSEKKAVHENTQVLMAGFPDYRIEKYLQKITENSFTVVVFVQEKNEKNTRRIFHSVHSPGTFLSYDTDSSPQITNNIMCIWMETYKPSLINASTRDYLMCGISIANIFTGQSNIFEYKTPLLMNPTTFDELERCISAFSPSEIIIVSPFENKQLNTIIQYSGIKASVVHNIPLSDEKAENCAKQKYIQHILSTFYGEETFQTCSEFHSNIIATQSFCYLLNFIQEHNPNLVRKINIPIFCNTSNRMILANHTLKQLNIIDDNGDGKKCGVLSSVLSFLNKCCTSMGKRRFQMQLLNPVFDEDWLNHEYRMISIMLENFHYIPIFRKILGNVKDIEKMCRQLIIKKIYPSSIYHLYNSIHHIREINTHLYDSIEITSYLCSDFYMSHDIKYIETQCTRFIDYINNILVIEQCKTIHSIQSYEQNIIKPGVSKKLDDYIQKNVENGLLFQQIREHLNNIIKKNENTSDIEYIREHETEKSGTTLQITKKRGLILKKILQDISNSSDGILKINENVSIPAKEFKITDASTSNSEIDCPILHKITKETLSLKDKINKEIEHVYGEFIENLEKEWFSILENIASYISKLDVLQSKVYIAKEYNYCKPVIQSESDKSFIDARDLRHCLIEHIQQNELYVPNDIEIGKDTNGILLYGTNAVGKTSMIRALGIACIIAQSGMYVPCSQFTYKPYTCIFSRILGNDNIFKGLSTFAVEMSELRIILKMADKNSLILGDELCSGTETESALSIFVSGLEELHNKESSFIFATHFHEIIHYDEIISLKKLKMKHLAVYYDREKDCLVYDRKLKDGSGTRMYGLEVCKSLYLPDEFLERAYSIRNKYFPDTKGELMHSTSIYNAKKIRGICEMCKMSIGEETHHLQEQKKSDENGFIGIFHKNHPANLLTVCEKCHLKIHSEYTPQVKKKFVKKKTTKGYVVTNV
jgi:DNA mismatch repair protein MutS